MKNLAEVKKIVHEIAKQLHNAADVLETTLIDKKPNLVIIDLIARQEVQTAAYALKDIRNSYEACGNHHQSRG